MRHGGGEELRGGVGTSDGQIAAAVAAAAAAASRGSGKPVSSRREALVTVGYCRRDGRDAPPSRSGLTFVDPVSREGPRLSVSDDSGHQQQRGSRQGKSRGSRSSIAGATDDGRVGGEASAAVASTGGVSRAAVASQLGSLEAGMLPPRERTAESRGNHNTASSAKQAKGVSWRDHDPDLFREPTGFSAAQGRRVVAATAHPRKYSQGRRRAGSNGKIPAADPEFIDALFRVPKTVKASKDALVVPPIGGYDPGVPLTKVKSLPSFEQPRSGFHRRVPKSARSPSPRLSFGDDALGRFNGGTQHKARHLGPSHHQQHAQQPSQQSSRPHGSSRAGGNEFESALARGYWEDMTKGPPSLARASAAPPSPVSPEEDEAYSYAQLVAELRSHLQRFQAHMPRQPPSKDQMHVAKDRVACTYCLPVRVGGGYILVGWADKRDKCVCCGRKLDYDIADMDLEGQLKAMVSTARQRANRGTTEQRKPKKKKKKAVQSKRDSGDDAAAAVAAAAAAAAVAAAQAEEAERLRRLAAEKEAARLRAEELERLRKEREENERAENEERLRRQLAEEEEKARRRREAEEREAKEQDDKHETEEEPSIVSDQESENDEEAAGDQQDTAEAKPEIQKPQTRKEKKTNKEKPDTKDSSQKTVAGEDDPIMPNDTDDAVAPTDDANQDNSAESEPDAGSDQGEGDDATGDDGNDNKDSPVTKSRRKMLPKATFVDDEADTIQEPERVVVRARRRVRVHVDEDEDLGGEPDSLDYLAQFCILPPSKLAHYKRVFEAHDEGGKGYLNPVELGDGLEYVNNSLMSEEQNEYLFTLLDLFEEHRRLLDSRAGRTNKDGEEPMRQIGLRLFAVIAALSERVVSLGSLVRRLLSQMDMKALQTKLQRAKQMFFCNATPQGELTLEDLSLELKAGGISPEHEADIMRQLANDGLDSLCFLDFLAYIPLFVFVHDSIVENPMDMSRTK